MLLAVMLPTALTDANIRQDNKIESNRKGENRICLRIFCIIWNPTPSAS